MVNENCLVKILEKLVTYSADETLRLIALLGLVRDAENPTELCARVTCQS